MKQLPENFCIKMDADNPLWKKYINWLNGEYYRELSGATEDYYGVWNKEADYYVEPGNATVLTLEQWDAIVNPKPEFKIGDWIIASSVTSPVAGKIVEIHPEGYYTSPKQSEGPSYFSIKRKDLRLATLEEIDAVFVLPKKWYVIVTEDNKDVLSRWRFKNQSHKLKVGQITGCVGTVSREHNDFNPITKEGVCDGYYDFGEEITFEQFKKHVLKEDIMDRKIIGYKWKEGFQNKYEKAAVEIVNSGIDLEKSIEDLNDVKRRGDSVEFTDSSIAKKQLKSVGVLDLWFEPVYEESSILNIRSENNEYKVTVKNDSADIWVRYESGNCNIPINDIQQLSVLINRLEDFKVGGYNIKVDSISIGCQKNIPVNELKKVFKVVDNLK